MYAVAGQMWGASQDGLETTIYVYNIWKDFILLLCVLLTQKKRVNFENRINSAL